MVVGCTLKRKLARSPARANAKGCCGGSTFHPAGTVSVTAPVLADSALCTTSTCKSTRLVVLASGTTAANGDTVTPRRGTLRTSRNTSP